MRFLAVLGLIFVVAVAAVPGEPTLILESADILAPFAPAVMERVAQAGLKAELRFAPFVRLQQDLASGAVDGAFFVGESFLKATTLYDPIPIPLYRNEYLAVTLADGPVIRGARDLRDKTVAYPRGYTGVGEVIQGADVTTVIDEEQGFMLLGAGRIQVLIASRTSTLMFGPVAAKPLKVHEPPLVTGQLYLVVRRSLPSANQALTSVFRQSIHDGSWERDVAAVVRAAVTQRSTAP